MKLLTSKQMRDVDRLTMEKIGIPGTTLMENAGIHVTQVLEEHFNPLDVLKIAVVCGSGNNGGDGFVIARQLYMRGVLPHVYVLCSREKVTGDARINLDIILNYKDIEVSFLPDLAAYEVECPDFDSCQVVVDAILGTGLSKPAEGYYARVIEDINNASASVISVDIPSGLFADEYRPVDVAIFADITVTFTAPKPGLILGEAHSYIGDLYTVSIGTPDRLIDDEKHNLNLITQEDVSGFFLPRKKTTHKGNYGHVLIVGGGRGKIGAVKMAGMAALRAGVGLATLGVPEPYMNFVNIDNSELMSEPLAANKDGFFLPEAVGNVVDLLEKLDLLVLGPGMGAEENTVRFVHDLIPVLDVPAIIDADGLNCIARDVGILARKKVPLVLTPHPGEMARLMGCSTGDVQENREKFARDFACQHDVFLILKGFRTVLAEPSGQVWINPTGNPGMATAGAGDVLSGILGGFCARINHRNPHAWRLACMAAIYLHGLAGDLAAEAFTEDSIIARDLINHLHAAIQKLYE